MPLPQEVLSRYQDSRSCADKGTLCHAPERSMYFGRDGVVSACCYSRASAFGRFPDQTIDEMWRSATAASMRSALRQGELPEGCELCATQILAGNCSNTLAAQYDRLVPSRPRSLLEKLLPSRQARPDFPAEMVFELSNKCNLECAMCSGFFSSSIRANREKLPAIPMQYDDSFLEQLEPYLPHLKRATFLGGEPFLIDLYYGIWERLIEVNPGCHVSITTNGTVYTAKVKRILERLNCGIVLSLDSLTKSTYESIRRNATFEDTMEHFEAFRQNNLRLGKENTIANCPMQVNAREIPDIVDFATEKDARIFFNTVVFPESASIRSLEADQQEELVAFYRERLRTPRSGKFAEANAAALESFCHQIELWIVESADEVTHACRSLAKDPGLEPALRTVVADVLLPADPTFVSLETVASPVQALEEYSSGLWALGRKLQQLGLLEGMDFDPGRQASSIEWIRSTISPDAASVMYQKCRTSARLSLEVIGRSSNADLSKKALAVG